MKFSLSSKPVAVFFLLTLFSCGQSEKEKAVLEEINKTLKSSTEEMETNSSLLMKSLAEKFNDPKTKDLVLKWGPKASVINTLSKRSLKSIDSLQQLLVKRYNKIYMEQALNIYTKYVTEVLNTEKGMGELFQAEANIPVNYENYQSPALADLFFSKLAFSISRLNAHLLGYCHSKCYFTGCDFPSSPRLMVTQSSSVLSPGESLEISAGIVTYVSAVNPTIQINNKILKKDREDFASTIIKAPLKPGVYSLPVAVTYTDVDGNEKNMSKDIKYKVVSLQDN